MSDSKPVPKLRKNNNLEINGNIYSPKEILENRKNNVTSPYAPILVNKNEPTIIIDTELSPNNSEQNSPDLKSLKNSSRRRLPTAEKSSLPRSVTKKMNDETDVFSPTIDRSKSNNKMIIASPPPIAIPQKSIKKSVINIKPIGNFAEVNEILSTSKSLKTKNKIKYSEMSYKERQEERRDFITKFKILKKHDNNIEIPENIMSEESGPDLEVLEKIHSKYVKNVLISQNTSQWRVYIIFIFMMFEKFGTSILKLNMTGYAMSQVKIMDKYDTLLIELGEELCVDGMSKWPAWLKLLSLLAFQMFSFIVIKYGAKWIGIGDLDYNKIQDISSGLYDNTVGIVSKINENNANQEISENPNQNQNPLSEIQNIFSGLFNGGIGENFQKMFSGITNKDEPQKVTTPPVAKPVKW